MQTPSSRIPTNIITGFLGVGKTTAIRHLLATKPEGETWSVLVNEFGEIGIDGALLAGTNAHIREVPGGCICCVAGLPMKIALNMLIATTKPDRLLIEPTGLGHPAEIIQTLTGEYYDSVLDVRATLTLVDARKLADERYTTNSTFIDQLQAADVLVASKDDLATANDRAAFAAMAAAFEPAKAGSFSVEQGRLALEWLDLPRREGFDRPASRQQGGLLRPQPVLPAQVQIPPGQDFVRRDQAGEGYFATGWLFNSEARFDFNRLFGWVMGLPVLRAKAAMNTDQGPHLFNAEGGSLSVTAAPLPNGEPLLDSRIEVISDAPLNAGQLEVELMTLRLPT